MLVLSQVFIAYASKSLSSVYDCIMPPSPLYLQYFTTEYTLTLELSPKRLVPGSSHSLVHPYNVNVRPKRHQVQISYQSEGF